MTQSIEEAIQTKNLTSHISTVEQHLQFIIELARSRSSEIQRSTCSTLIIHDLHIRDSLVELYGLTSGNVMKNDFEWLKTQRYYFEYSNVPAQNQTLLFIDQETRMRNNSIGNNNNNYQ